MEPVIQKKMRPTSRFLSGLSEMWQTVSHQHSCCDISTWNLMDLMEITCLDWLCVFACFVLFL